jgi:hypothetical protein
MFTSNVNGSEPTKQGISPPFATVALRDSMPLVGGRVRPRLGAGPLVSPDWARAWPLGDGFTIDPAHPIERPIDTACLSAEEETPYRDTAGGTRSDAEAVSQDTTFDALSRWRHGFESRWGCHEQGNG